MNPTSPYGIAKVASYNLVRHYRRAYELHACNGILFNHGSIRRGSNFVEQKICKGVAEIYMGKKHILELGNLDATRDFGHAKDYVKAMVMIINYSEPDDFVIASGESHSIRELCEIAFGYKSLDYSDHVVQNKKYFRDEELPYLKGDCSKARQVLGWQPEYTFESMIYEIIDYWVEKLSV